MHLTIADLIGGLESLPGKDRAESEHPERLEDNRNERVQDATQRPLTDEEVEALLGLFGLDECSGNAWTRLKQQIDNAQRFGLLC